MSEEENPSVEQAVAQATESEIQQDDSQAEVQQIQDQKRESDQDYNWREARRKMDILEQKNRELQERVNNLSSPKSSVEDDDLSKLADDDIVTAKQARNLAQKMARQTAEEVIRSREAATLDERLSLKFPDFNQVCTKENIEIFKQNEPELAMSLAALANDPYAQATAAYKLLKKHGLGTSENMSKNKQKAEENSKKPVSVQSVTKQNSAIGNAHAFENGLTPELRKQLWKEMQEAAKRY
jgi:hypothetical protein